MIRALRMQRIAAGAALMLTAGAIIGVPGATSAAGGGEANDAELEREVDARLDAIERDTAVAPDAAWSGTYYHGDGLGTNVTLGLSQKLGVAATWQGCLGTYGLNLGGVELSPEGTLRMQYTRPNADEFGGFPSELRPVVWGERHYLVAVGAESAFIAAVHAGNEPRASAGGRFLLRKGDEHKPVAGLPRLPVEWVARLRNSPTFARVTGVTPLGMQRRSYVCVHRYRLGLDVADAGRLWPGETLHHKSRFGHLIDITASEAGDDAAEALAVVTDFDCKPQRDAPRVGWTLTTGAYDPVAANRKIESARRDRDARQTEHQ